MSDDENQLETQQIYIDNLKTILYALTQAVDECVPQSLAIQITNRFDALTNGLWRAIVNELDS